MIASMTGFARREISGSWGALVCELRSVNHRFLESGFRLPDELRAAEGELRQRLARDIKRGKVDCSISHRRVQGAESALEVDAAAWNVCWRPCAIFPAPFRESHGECARRSAVAGRYSR